MKTGILAALAAAGVTAVLAASAWAQQTLPIPAGSYRSTCTDIRTTAINNSKVMNARCQKANGGYERSTLRYDNCRGDIGNNNGKLVCSTGGAGPQPPVPQLPAGSYKQSCTNASVRSGLLSATCKDSAGRYQNTSLRYEDCRGRDIANINGRLSCAIGGGGGGNAVPTGSYQRTCTNAYMSGTILHANCRLAIGSSTRRTSLDTRDCRGRDIGNINGQLTCSNNGGGGVPPGARGVITLYTQPGFAGRSATIDRAAGSLGAWQMADRARSLQIRSGRWQVCSEPNFRGRCVTVDRNQRDLRALGLDGQISSVQPVR